MEHLNLKTHSGRIRFVLCIVLLLFIFSSSSFSNCYVLMESLIEAVREGRISKALARLIIRKLKARGITVDPELIKVAEAAC